MEFIAYIVAGAAVGFAVGVTGVGGGSLMTPILMLFGFQPHVAVGTDLLYAAITKTGGVLAHRQRSTVRWDIVAFLSLGSIPASLATIYALYRYFPDANAYSHLLSSMLGVMLILTSVVLLFRKRIISGSLQENPFTLLSHLQSRSKVYTWVMGIVLGVMVTLSSVGAGAFGAAVLLMLYPRLATIKVVGTDIAHAVPLTLVAGMGHLLLGNVNYVLLGSLLIGSLPAIYLGTQLATRLPEKLLQSVLASMLLFMGVKYAFF
ncbi:sulfite exporter TauE/SafE family protein [Ketobacter sp. MCCC 1A13808]|uniref:sulfite exporter TauE/SafE family protein n=1 Tax=Ketobacter sp. MCCC 1A13808 TaxID=2602738 RepID=UPI000F1AF37B|nr:sulfite exporter TauE/SafE family protein [Ketobacter sp. MCCC 1A13808]MVF12405.1 sulfite exporter TauE/SafE family protein [Ketobacter sp. MCCC 1A13808]RLP55780.1 MAG: sulfite exporter TauE/SafE family protein [Ketobacter sp.]